MDENILASAPEEWTCVGKIQQRFRWFNLTFESFFIQFDIIMSYESLWLEWSVPTDLSASVRPLKACSVLSYRMPIFSRIFLETLLATPYLSVFPYITRPSRVLLSRLSVGPSSYPVGLPRCYQSSSECQQRGLMVQSLSPFAPFTCCRNWVMSRRDRECTRQDFFSLEPWLDISNNSDIE